MDGTHAIVDPKGARSLGQSNKRKPTGTLQYELVAVRPKALAACLSGSCSQGGDKAPARKIYRTRGLEGTFVITSGEFGDSRRRPHKTGQASNSVLRPGLCTGMQGQQVPDVMTPSSGSQRLKLQACGLGPFMASSLRKRKVSLFRVCRNFGASDSASDSIESRAWSA